MKPASEWRETLAEVRVREGVTLVTGRDGLPTVKAGSIYLHSRYRPQEEAVRLVESAGLDAERPVLVVGLGLGYHVLELLGRGYTVGVVEPDAGVAKLAIEGPFDAEDVPVGIGDPDEIASSAGFDAFAKQMPQLLVHPATARIHPRFGPAIESHAARVGLRGERLNIAVVGPMYGGSLPMTGYLERAFRSLGHRTLLVDNSGAWQLYNDVTDSVESKRGSNQLTQMLVNLLGEWSYARVAEFSPEICIVMAQAPVSLNFPARLRNDGIVTAFWFVENWRHLDYWRAIAPRYDYLFHIQKGEFERQLTEAGCPAHAFVQTGCDPEVHKPAELTEEERAEFECDISFAGAGYPNRNQVFAGLTDYRFKLWGVDWRGRDLERLVCRPGERFTPELFAKIVAGSAINLNLHSSTTHPGVDPHCDAINPRVFEIAACGGFQLCDPCIGLDGFFDFESELPVYRDLGELRKFIDHYLDHPGERSAIAERARERVLRDHTYEKRAQQMLDLILDHYGGRTLRKGVRMQRTVSEMAERVGPDTPLGAYLASLPGDLLFTQEHINEHLAEVTGSPSYPEAVFLYLRDLRNTAEQLMGAYDYAPGG